MNLSDDGLNLNRTVKITIDSEVDSKLDCLEELVKYAREIAATTPAPHTLFVSGGIDSQAMVYVWKLANVPFDVVHVNYEGFNLHDRNEIIQFCEQQNVSIRIIDFDLIDFLENRLEDYAMKYECSSPQLCTHMAMSELVPSGTKLFSGNLPTKTLSLDNTIFGLYRYAALSGYSVIPFFLLQNEKVAKAAIICSERLPKTPDGSNYVAKCAHYQMIGIPIIPQYAKLNGFEMVKCYYDHYPERVTTKMKWQQMNTRSKRVFDQLFRNKYQVRLNNDYSPRLVVTDQTKSSN